MNLRLLRLLIYMCPFLATILPAAAQTPAVSEEVQKWMQECEKGYEQGQYAKVLPACQRAVDVLQPLLPEHPTFATALHDLALLHAGQGNYAQAEPLYLRSLRLREETLSREHPLVAQSLNSLALLYGAQGKYEQAEPLFLRSLKIREKVLGPEHPDVADSLMDLAAMYEDQGDYFSSEPLKLRGLRICEKKLAPTDPTLAICLNNVAMLYKAQGKFIQAEPYLLRSLRIFEKTLDPDHPTLNTAVNNLASLYQDQGNYSAAEPLYVRSLRSGEKTLGPGHSLVAQRLNNLALLYKQQGRLSEAEPLYLRSLSILEKVLSPEHPLVAITLNNLAGLYQDQGNYSQAELLYLRCLHIREKVLGPEHPFVATTLNNLAGLYQEQGNYPQAESHYVRSLRIREKTLGPEHREVAFSLNNLAMLRLAQGLPEQVLPMFQRALNIREGELQTIATEERITTLLDTMRSDEDRVYSLLLINDSAKARSLALSMSLLRKGRSAEAGLMTGWAIQTSLISDDQRQRFARWQAVRNQYAALFLRGPAKLDDASRQAHQVRLQELKNQIDIQEDGLAHSSPQLQQRRLPEPQVIGKQVAARLPKGSAFVDVLWFRPVLFQATGIAEKRQGRARYLALILFPDQRIDFVDLGDGEQIDQVAADLLTAMRDLRQEPRQPAQSLYQKVMAPLLAKLDGVRQIYLSLDGSLNLVPFTALHDGKQYLLDAPYQIQYLSSGRDLLRETMGQPQQPALVMADPDFGSHMTSNAQTESRTVDVETRGLYDGLASLPQLKGARAEGTFVSGVLHVPPLLGAEATEARLRQVRSPWLLHIATHGLFLNTASADSKDSSVALVGEKPKDTAPTGVSAPDDPSSRSALLLASAAHKAASADTAKGPLLIAQEARSLSRSALVLAGAADAANAPDAANDGLLTAEEARTLSLFGTQLVVLSACDTGRGTVRAGQGVYGLRRAFLAAGAQTVVMSLWPVSDSSTQGLMQRYYRLLLDEKKPRGRISGLLEAMKAVKAEHPHPYYWAPFIANGLDAPLHPLHAGP